MKTCEITTLFAYIACVYIVTSLFYILLTINVGTPFNDILRKYPHLLKIKKKSVQKRRNIFYLSLVISTVLFIILRPFGSC